jgi:UDP-N-acetyl-D-glucosamine/UDP-N-acetyl-D-galactosamine dehydrogenase
MMSKDNTTNSTLPLNIAVLGLGYVGLPLAVALAKAHELVLGFDINESRVAALRQGFDHTGEINNVTLKNLHLTYSTHKPDLASANFFIVTVPTPIDEHKNPDLTPLRKASETIAPYLKKRDIVVYESTVYPGVTEDFCGPILETGSGLKCGVDFTLGYSPERINPGDKLHTVEKITKVVAGQDAATLERVALVYEAAIAAGVHRAPSIRVAEAAKVIENTQRDVNIALMNELALIFDRMNLRTQDVLEAARTKWNFLPFSPGLVGGHCIGVDPYYLTQKAQQLGYHPEVILAGRRLNDGMGQFIAQKTIKLMIAAGLPIKGARVGVLGLTFKENVPDLRNSRVPDIIRELEDFGIEVIVHDPIAPASEAMHEYKIELQNFEKLIDLDAIILAVAHQAYQKPEEVMAKLKSSAVLIDVKSIYKPGVVGSSQIYWSL